MFFVVALPPSHADCAHPLLRYARHLSSWPTSTTASYVFPAALFFSSWSALVAFLCTHHPSLASVLRRASFSSSLVSTFLSPIALLLTLRTNRALERLLEARKAWGLMTSSCRGAAGMLCAYGADVDAASALLATRYLVLFGWALKARLRGQDDGDLVRCALPPSEADWLLGRPEGTNRPSAMVARIRSLVACMATPKSSAARPTEVALCATAHRVLEERLQDLDSVTGICNRILTSPIPPTYTRHTSRVLCLYLFLLPLALTGLGVSSTATVILTSLTSYVLIGIDEIGVEVEHVFPLLPMHGLAAAVQRSVVEQVALVGDMPLPSHPCSRVPK
uniref:Bestrophin homolog n=1 Tax=Odontella aurita TaxID=265563 RepID=A0A7S4J646_9STRA|mmetsp:Transcript_3936/g.10865  ORF Transcript_3936/g.10865 Transcript_3936/m.10865 type:complete len:335 (+) Transcript_3936:62-1066(+)